MVQVYLLSVVLNGLAGFLLLQGNALEEGSKLAPFSGGFRLIVGIAAGVTGILKLLIPMGRPPILGDLLPAAAGILAGFALAYSSYAERSSVVGDGKGIDGLGNALLALRKQLGIASLVIAGLHFVFPRALFI